MISAIITSHNEGARLRKTIDSLLDHGGVAGDLELVLIDDAGTDDSFDFLQNRGDYRGCSVIHRRFTRTAGLVKARHHGAVLANGEGLLFLDAHLAFSPGSIARLEESRRRCGPLGAITPTLSHLDEEEWQPRPANGQVLWIDENLEMVWIGRNRPVPLVPVVLGCCWLLSRETYFRIGGFDIGLTRWGCENIDIIAKLYAHGGSCYTEDSSLVGHLFRDRFPYAVEATDILYNRMRTAFLHMPRREFWDFLSRCHASPSFEGARDRFLRHVSELRHIEDRMERSRCRKREWYWRTFLDPAFAMSPEERGVRAALESARTLAGRASGTDAAR